jgi:hypothetical protein
MWFRKTRSTTVSADAAIDWKPYLRAFKKRASLLEDPELFIIYLQTNKQQLLPTDMQSIIVGKTSPILEPDGPYCYHISCSVEPAEGMTEFDVFAAFAKAGFWATDSRGELGYWKGPVTLDEIDVYLEAALRAMLETCGLGLESRFSALGDSVLEGLLRRALPRVSKRV